MNKHIKGEIELFHDYGVFIPNRIVYFGSEHYADDDTGESGVDHASSKRIIKNLVFLDNKEKSNITIYWNSCGGDWDKGMAIYDVIKGLRSKVTMVGFGMVRSMGTIIMQACDKRYLSPNCDFMIHDGTEGSYGESKTVEAWGKYSEFTRKKMYNIYYNKIIEKNPKYTLKKLEHMCTHDCIMTGQEAVDLGLADKVL